MKFLFLGCLLTAVCGLGSMQPPQSAKPLQELAKLLKFGGRLHEELTALSRNRVRTYLRVRQFRDQLLGIQEEELDSALAELGAHPATRAFIYSLIGKAQETETRAILGSLDQKIDEAVLEYTLKHPMLQLQPSAARLAGIEVRRVGLSGQLSALQWIAEQGRSESAFINVPNLVEENPVLLVIPSAPQGGIERQVVHVELSDPYELMKVVRSIQENPNQRCALQGALCLQLGGTHTVSIQLACVGGPQLELSASGKLELDPLGERSFSFSLVED